MPNQYLAIILSVLVGRSITDRRMKTSSIRITCLLIIAVLFSGALTSRAQFPYISTPFGGGSTAQAIVTAAVVATVVYAIARNEANERQRQIAEQRARQSYARMPEGRKTAMKKKKVRYIAVDTERSAKSSPKAKKTIMVYDTETNKVASNVAYDVEKAPSVGSTAKIDNYSAEYVGSGL